MCNLRKLGQLFFRRKSGKKKKLPAVGRRFQEPVLRKSALTHVDLSTRSMRVSEKITSNPSKMKTTMLTDIYTVPSQRYTTVNEIIAQNGFELHEQIDKGGFSTVYKARRLWDGLIVACKVMNLEVKPSYRSNAKNELYVLEQCQHPHIIKLYRHFFVETANCVQVYMFLQFAEGSSLANFMHRRKRGLDQETCQRMFTQILSAVYYMHNKHIAHRDIKLENILLDRNANCAVSDFGLSRVGRHRSGELIMIHRKSGTPLYMAPEIIVAKDFRADYDPFLTDVWALGVTLFYLVNKSFPFPSSDEQMRLAAQMSHSFTFSDMRQFEPPDELVDLLKRALEPKAEKRATMDELVAHPWIARHVKEIETSMAVKKKKKPLPAASETTINSKTDDTSTPTVDNATLHPTVGPYEQLNAQEHSDIGEATSPTDTHLDQK